MNKIKELFQDELGVISSKRVAAFITLFYALIIYIIKGDNMDHDIFLTLMVFVASALGISSIEKFKRK